MKNKLFICSLLLVVVSCVPAKQKQDNRTEEAGGNATFDIVPDGEYFNQCLPFEQSDHSGLKATHKRIVFSKNKPRFTLITDYYSNSCQEHTPRVAVSERIEGDINYGGHFDIGDSNVWTRRIEVTVTKWFYVAKQQPGLGLVRSLSDEARSVGLDQEYLITAGNNMKLNGVLSAKRGERNKMHVHLVDKKIDDKQIKKYLVPSNLYIQTVRK